MDDASTCRVHDDDDDVCIYGTGIFTILCASVWINFLVRTSFVYACVFKRKWQKLNERISCVRVSIFTQKNECYK